jgi:hypothetical protein
MLAHVANQLEALAAQQAPARVAGPLSSTF